MSYFVISVLKTGTSVDIELRKLLIFELDT